jgi:hypothetical protein
MSTVLVQEDKDQAGFFCKMFVILCSFKMIHDPQDQTTKRESGKLLDMPRQHMKLTENSNHFTPCDHWLAITNRWYQCSLHLYDIPTSLDVSNATDGDESAEQDFTTNFIYSLRS